jgi:hypothetical protein
MALHSKPKASLSVDTQNQSLCYVRSCYTLGYREIGMQEHPGSTGLGLRASVRLSAIGSAADDERPQGRQLTQGRYYASLYPSHSSSHLSSHSDELQASASIEEVPVEGGVALTEEAVETHVPDIITKV